MKSKESERVRCTHELVSAHRRTSQGMGKKQAKEGGLTSCRIPREGKVREPKKIWPVKVPTSWGEKEVRVRMRKESKCVEGTHQLEGAG